MLNAPRDIPPKTRKEQTCSGRPVTAGLARCGAVAACSRRGRADARTQPHRKRRPFQPIHIPRTHADQQGPGTPGRFRLCAQERLLCRHVGIEHQLAARWRRRYPRIAPAAASSGISTAAGSRTFGDFGFDIGMLYYWYPGDALRRGWRARQPESQHVGDLRRRRLEMDHGEVLLQPRQQDLRRPRLARHVVFRSDGDHPGRRQRSEPASRTGASRSSVDDPRTAGWAATTPLHRTRTGRSASHTRCPRISRSARSTRTPSSANPMRLRKRRRRRCVSAQHRQRHCDGLTSRRPSSRRRGRPTRGLHSHREQQ